ALEQAAAAVAALTVRQRHIAGLVRRQRQREAAQGGLHRIETVGLGVDGDGAEIAGARDPGFEPVEAAHGLVFSAVEFLAARKVEPRRGEYLRRKRTVCAFTSPLAGEIG